MKNKKLLLMVLVGLIASFTPVYALPGQTTAQFKAWLKSKPILNGSQIEFVEYDYYYTKNIKNGKIEFSATIDGGTHKVKYEGYTYNEAFSDKKLVSSIKELYGQQMYNELMNSKIIYNKKSTAFYGVTNMVLKGAKYGFLVGIAIPDKTGSEANFTVNILTASEIPKTMNKISKGEL